MINIYDKLYDILSISVKFDVEYNIKDLYPNLHSINYPPRTEINIRAKNDTHIFFFTYSRLGPQETDLDTLINFIKNNDIGTEFNFTGTTYRLESCSVEVIQIEDVYIEASNLIKGHC